MIPYIYDFLTILFDKLKDKSKIKNIILFGSFARNQQRKDSDIDVFIDVNAKDKDIVNKIVKESLNEFEVKKKDKWMLKGIDNSIVPIIDDIRDKRWNELKSEISAYGIILYGKYQSDSQKGRQSVIIEYDLSKIKQKDKMKVLRKLNGYKVKIGKKIYEQKGLVEEAQGDKLSLSGALLLDIKEYKKPYDFLKQNKVPVRIRRIWRE